MSALRLTFEEKAELDALVNFFGGKSFLHKITAADPLFKSMRRKGLSRWGKSRAKRSELIEHVATKKGIAIAKRFKVDWSARWEDAHPREPE